MDRITNIPDKKGLKRIVIVGGGFAGLHLARKIHKKHFQVILIDKVNYYQFQPLMYQVATAGLEPSSISYPHRKAFQKYPEFHFRTCKALRVRSSDNILETTIGEIHYDYLVIATGCDTNYFGNEILKESTFGLKSVSESLLIRNRILLSFEQALNTTSEKELQKLLTFVVIGGGATGIELAGALADMRKNILPKDYPELDLTQMKIHLVDASPRLLSSMSEYASEKAAETLRNRGVIIHHSRSVTSHVDHQVIMDNGDTLFSQNVFWVAGVKPNSLEGFREDNYVRGRLLVNEYNQVQGHKNVFCLGDTALMITDEYPKGHPQVAQPALQMASNLAHNINQMAKGKSNFRKFHYNDKGSLATIGRNAAVADIGKFHFSGLIAWWLWLIVHILSIVGMKNKIFVFLDWAWSYFNYDVSLRLLIQPKASQIYDKS
ncbi:MAG: NAD(P)/FAD-dependent oxidoreductase [Bacteroidales bacterium]|nr:NAD(P)/FAD-dependent oxidoreductase [Bacteroidales bacterium]